MVLQWGGPEKSLLQTAREEKQKGEEEEQGQGEERRKQKSQTSSCRRWSSAKAPDSVKWESLQSDFISTQRTCDWTGVKAEDELISRWHAERTEKLHTAQREPLTLQVWSACEVKCVDHDDYGFMAAWKVQTSFMVWEGGSVWWCLRTAHSEITCQSNYADRTATFLLT